MSNTMDRVPTKPVQQAFLMAKARKAELRGETEGISEAKVKVKQDEKNTFISAAQARALEGFNNWMHRDDDDNDKRANIKTVKIVFEVYKGGIIYRTKFKTEDGEKYSLNDGVLDNPLNIIPWKTVDDHIEVSYENNGGGTFTVDMDELKISFKF